MRTRTLHLVDIENLLGNPRATAQEAEHVLDQYLMRAAWQPGDLVTIAANPHLAARFMFHPPVECSLRSAIGPDGADLVLLAHAAPEFVARRAGRLVIGSGDHAFLSRALQARKLGVGVVVVARTGSVHRGWHAHGFPVLALDHERELAA